MKLELYVVYDKVAEEAGPPFSAKNRGIALRQFTHLLQAQKVNEVDFDLYKIAILDTENMAIASDLVKIPVNISNATLVAKDGNEA